MVEQFIDVSGKENSKLSLGGQKLPLNSIDETSRFSDLLGSKDNKEKPQDSQLGTLSHQLQIQKNEQEDLTIPRELDLNEKSPGGGELLVNNTGERVEIPNQFRLQTTTSSYQIQIEENEKAYFDIVSQLDLKTEQVGIILEGNSDRKPIHIELPVEIDELVINAPEEYVEDYVVGSPFFMQLEPFDNSKQFHLFVEKATRVAITVTPIGSLGNSSSTNQSIFSLSSQLKTDFSKSFMDLSQEQSTNQQQTNGQIIIQSVMKLRTAQELQVASHFKNILSDAENPNRIIGDLGVGLDRRAELPMAMQAVNTHVRSPKWGQEVGKRLVYMVNNNMQEAKINLTPEKLGPIQIKLSLNKELQLSVVIHAQHGTTRELLENAIPKLRELLDETHVNLASIDVGDDSLFQQEQEGLPDEKKDITTESATEGESINKNVIYHSDNLVDYYA